MDFKVKSRRIRKHRLARAPANDPEFVHLTDESGPGHSQPGRGAAEPPRKDDGTTPIVQLCRRAASGLRIPPYGITLPGGSPWLAPD